MEIEIDIDEDDPYQLPSGFRSHTPHHSHQTNSHLPYHSLQPIPDHIPTHHHQEQPPLLPPQEAEEEHQQDEEDDRRIPSYHSTAEPHQPHHFNHMPPIPPSHTDYEHSIPMLDDQSEARQHSFDLNDEKSGIGYQASLRPALDDGLDEFLLTADLNSPANPHWGPAPSGRALRRNRTRKRVALTNGHLVIDRPIPARLLGFLPRRGEEEFEMMSYTAATCDVSLFFFSLFFFSLLFLFLRLFFVLRIIEECPFSISSSS